MEALCMQCFDKLRLTFGRSIKAIVFLLIFVSINTLICCYLSPSAHKSNEMWNYYYSQKNADTIIVGTSVTEMINEFVVNEYTGRKCINMGTPSQYFVTSRDIMAIAAQENPVDTIILMMGFDALESAENLSSSLSIEKSFYDSKSFRGKIVGFFKENIKYSFDRRNIQSSESINRWMSWPVNCTIYFDQIKTNLEKKRYYKDIVNNPETKLWCQNTVKYDRTPMPRAKELSPATKEAIDDINMLKISGDSLVILKQMCEYCTANGITFIVMISPHNSGYRDSFGGEYEKLNSLTAGVVEEAGCMYLNLNDIPNVKDIMTDEFFVDSEHVANEGVEAASGIMSDVLNLLTGKRN